MLFRSDEDDGHSEEEAAEHTVITITKAGTYRVSGTLSKGQIAKEGTTQEDVDAGNAKKQWKFDAAIESLVSIAFDAEEEGTGSLAVNSDNEGIETYLHLTVNAGAGQEGGTPFTQVGVRELRRLGILTMVIPTGCAVGAEVVQGILTGFIKL